MNEMLFGPNDVREWTVDEQEFVATAYRHAIDALKRTITPLGFAACSLADNEIYGTDVNYRSVWARDGAMTLIWTLDLQEESIRECRRNTLRTLFRHQLSSGLIPTNVRIDTDHPEFSGVGGVAGIDSVMWAVIAMCRYGTETHDWSLVDEFRTGIDRAMMWLRAQDVNNCGLLEIPEAGDWTDLFARSYHVLYDEVVWYRCVSCYRLLLERQKREAEAQDYKQFAEHVRKAILRTFWPTTNAEPGERGPAFTSAQYSLGDARYLLAQVTPFSFSWRCDVLGNLLAFINNLLDPRKAMMTFRFLWGVGVSDPWPVKNLYPPVQAGDGEWKEYFAVNLLNLPNHYHNGGIWPFVGAIWVRYIHKLGLRNLAKRELLRLAQLCSMGASQPWEFNEWHHGETGRPMGKAFQAWSAAGFIQACHDLQIDPSHMDAHE